jgi:hypothetical protein
MLLALGQSLLPPRIGFKCFCIITKQLRPYVAHRSRQRVPGTPNGELCTGARGASCSHQVMQTGVLRDVPARAMQRILTVAGC